MTKLIKHITTMKNTLTILLITGALLFIQNAAFAQSNQTQTEPGNAKIQKAEMEKVPVMQVQSVKMMEVKTMHMYSKEIDKSRERKLTRDENDSKKSMIKKRVYALDEKGNIIGAEKMDPKTIQKLINVEKQTLSKTRN